MKGSPFKTERIHSLDSLRAVMMLLGLVIHSAITYGAIDYGDIWSLKDKRAIHTSNDFIVVLIHVFRMPIFFLIAGFFGSMLFYKRKPLKMIKNRISRIVYPFVTFLLLLWPTLVFSFVYTRLLLSGSNNALSRTIEVYSNPLVLIPQNTFHLWFLYYLILITTVTVLLGILFKNLPNFSKYISNIFKWIIQKPILRLLILVVLTCLIYLSLGISMVEPSTSFIPQLNTFIFYFFFYNIGWLLFKSKHLLDSMMRLDWFCLISGIALFTIYFALMQSYRLNYKLVVFINSLTVWLFIFGIVGLFIRYGSKPSKYMRYISDASYWVYLVHLSFAFLIPGLLYNWKAPATLKFLTVLITTNFICFLMYHYLVRSSFIGKFLNGRKYTSKL